MNVLSILRKKRTKRKKETIFLKLDIPTSKEKTSEFFLLHFEPQYSRFMEFNNNVLIPKVKTLKSDI